MYLLHINPRESSKWVAPPPEELVTTDKLVRGGSQIAGGDIERNGGTRTPQMTHSSATSTHTD